MTSPIKPTSDEVKLVIKGIHWNFKDLPKKDCILTVKILESSVKYGPVYINKYRSVDKVTLPLKIFRVGQWCIEDSGMQFRFTWPYKVTIKGASSTQGDITTSVQANNQETREKARLLQAGHTIVRFSLKESRTKVTAEEEVLLEATEQQEHQVQTKKDNPDCFVMYEVVRVPFKESVPRSHNTSQPTSSRFYDKIANEYTYPTSIQRNLYNIEARKPSYLYYSLDAYTGLCLF